MRYILLFCLTLSSHIAFSQTLTLLEGPVSFHPDAHIPEAVRIECQLDNHFEQQLGNVLRKENGIRQMKGTADAQNRTLADQTLRLEITNVFGLGGGVWTGAKSITVSATLFDRENKPLRQTNITRWSTGGMWAAVKGTCSILDRCVKTISKDLLVWVRNANHKIKDEPAPPMMEPGTASTEDDKASSAADSAEKPSSK